MWDSTTTAATTSWVGMSTCPNRNGSSPRPKSRVALSVARNNLAELADFSGANLQKVKNTLAVYFTDPGCTALKPQFQSMSDADLTNLMSQPAGGAAGNYIALPASVQAMALKVKNNTWGHREKEFRVYDYKPYSDDTQWNYDQYVGNGLHVLAPNRPHGHQPEAR